MCLGGEFQREGGGGPVLAPEWTGEEMVLEEPTGWSVVMEEVGEAGGGLIMEGFVGEEKDFVFYVLWDKEPVEILVL